MKKDIFGILIIIVAIFFLTPILCNLSNSNPQIFSPLSIFCTFNDFIISFISWAQQSWVITIGIVLLIIIIFILVGLHFTKSGF